jgi:CheY-like chemotaxis protein
MSSAKNTPLILVVDDDASIRLLLEEELRAEGYEVAVAANGEEALQWISENQPDLVTLDIKMPGMMGLEVLRRIKQERPDLPVVMVTAYSSFRHDHDAEPADAYEVKSSDLAPLKRTIGRLLETKTAGNAP